MTQECVFNADLFSLYIDALLRKQDTIKGFTFGGRNLNNSRYAHITWPVRKGKYRASKREREW